MKSWRFNLQASERRKLATISNREIDSFARAHATRQDQRAAQEENSRQALRDVLRRQ